MGADLFGVMLLAVVVLFPMALHLYLARLPVAPACPSCSATTRATPDLALARLLPAMLITSRGECGRCGWHGRMRWQWATRTAPRRRR